MKILKYGSIEDIKQYRFECRECGYAFPVYEYDYTELICHKNELYMVCTCPCCKNRVYKRKLRLEGEE